MSKDFLQYIILLLIQLAQPNGKHGKNTRMLSLNLLQLFDIEMRSERWYICNYDISGINMFRVFLKNSVVDNSYSLK